MSRRRKPVIYAVGELNCLVTHHKSRPALTDGRCKKNKITPDLIAACAYQAMAEGRFSLTTWLMTAFLGICAFRKPMCQRALRTSGLLPTLPEPLSRGGSPVCCVRILPLTGAIDFIASVVEFFLRALV